MSEPDETKGEIDIPEGLDLEGVPPERIVWIEDEAAQIFKANPAARILADWLASGRKAEILDLKADPVLAERLEFKRAEIQRDLPGLFAEMQGDPGRSPSQWRYGDRVVDGQYSSMIQRPHEGEIKLTAPEGVEFPVRVGDVVRIIDTQHGCRPLPGHVVDIDGWWIIVSGPLGRKQSFYGQTGYLAGEYRWRLEPYITEKESSQ